MNMMDFFMKEAPEAAQAFNGLIKSLSESKGLDPKTKQLIYVSMRTAQGDTAATVAHAHMLRKLGASRDELKEAILMTLTVSGIKGVATCLKPALNTFDSEVDEK
ncbi:carboxymuconolactone decarboxylase family protein [Sporolactobacillus shoreicorticis]|uniref:Carboxymuconolactone decarboxylase family protein n=1 Tax=Sporolactobacillus shoreicorticis TaxID=1923877 RepID=A0ABW5S8V8_9BACL|nr:carboxymuconolactone decarboxylase family protein [Sporolactobacillus shoreicorticis]MCO7126948.1 carboxymuconolactone decarboxylase family protein [Sporolactobacillus shoreicorticis]